MPGFLFRLFRKSDPTPGTAPGHRGRHHYTVRLAVYDSLVTTPRIIDLDSSDIPRLLEDIAQRTYALSHEKGGKLPYMVIKEIVENLIHADFRNAVISILPDGNTIRVSDHGPGISEKDRAFLPGYTTADSSLRKYIRGVGSGLPIVRESMTALGGNVTIEDNLKAGCVVTICYPSSDRQQGQIPKEAILPKEEHPGTEELSSAELPGHLSQEVGQEGPSGRNELQEFPDLVRLNETLSERHKKVLLLTADLGEAGPSTIVKKLNLSLSTAYRDLVTPEEHGLVHSPDNTGKRKITKKGAAFVSLILK